MESNSDMAGLLSSALRMSYKKLSNFSQELVRQTRWNIGGTPLPCKQSWGMTLAIPLADASFRTCNTPSSRLSPHFPGPVRDLAALHVVSLEEPGADINVRCRSWRQIDAAHKRPIDPE